MKAPSLAIVLGHPGAGEDDEEEGGGDHEQAELDAAEALIEAIHAKDAKGVVEAHKTLYDLCASYDEEEETDGGK